MLVSLTIILLFPWIRVVAQTCVSSYSQHNTKLQGHVVAKYSASHTYGQCVKECDLQTRCHSINYYSSQGICELNNANHLTNPESLVYSAGCQYLNYILRAVRRCSNKLCSYPLECQVEKNGQDYKCENCQDKHKVLTFPNKVTTDKVVYENPFVQLTAFTLSMWVQVDPATDAHTSFSYAARTGHANEIFIVLKRKFTRLQINDQKFDVAPSIVDGQWHHLCVTWTNVDGSFSMYIDGISKAQGNMKTGHVIQKGVLVLGQDQDSYMGGFQSYQSFQGNLTSVNLWDKVLTAGEISALASRCSTAEGNVIKWTDFHDKISGNLKLKCSRFCDT